MDKTQRMQWWRHGRFGMFIHFGLYSPAAGTWQGKDWPGAGEWLLTNAKADPVEYRNTLLSTFNPVKFNAVEWAQIAKDAGMQYVVITTKHHDGFCLWQSELTDYDVASTPFKRDIMKELAQAVRAEGLHMGWYHSIMDWTHPDYLPRREWDSRPADPLSFPRYVQYMHAQLKELLTKYGRIDVLWFDGEWESTWTHDWGKRTDDWVRSLQPQIIVNNRVDTGRAGLAGFASHDGARGDFGTPEQTIPNNGMPGQDWETCMTMNDTWGFKDSDSNWKSSRTLIRMLCDIASKGGNFLLNVGPRGDGSFPPESVQRLKDMGAWLRVNGKSIYGTQASPFPRPLPWGRVTRAGSTLYLHVFDWPAQGTIDLPGLHNRVVSASVIGSDSARATVARMEGGVRVSLAGSAPHSDVSVVELVLEGEPHVEPQHIGAGSDGRVTCSAADAHTTGSIQYETRFHNLGFWTDPTSTATWSIKLPTAGRYAVSVEYSSIPHCAGEIQVTVGAQKLSAVLPARGGWEDFATVQVGLTDIPAAVPVLVEARALTKPGEAFVNLRSVTLAPAK